MKLNVRNKLKNAISVLLCLASVAAFSLNCAVLAAADAPAAETGFTDVPEDAWYAEAVRFCRENGYMAGTSATTFSPDMRMTRAMFATVLWRIDGAPTFEDNVFDDVPDDAWYKNAANWGYRNRLIIGTGEGRFSPDGAATREQIALVIKQFAYNRGSDVYARADISGYADAADVSAWAVDGMRWAVGAGLISGKDTGRLDPKGAVTRAELAQIIANFMTGVKTYADDPGLLEKLGLEIDSVYARVDTHQDMEGLTGSEVLSTDYLFRVTLKKTDACTLSDEDLGNMKAYVLFHPVDAGYAMHGLPLERDGLDFTCENGENMRHGFPGPGLDGKPEYPIQAELYFFYGDSRTTVTVETYWEFADYPVIE